MWPVLLWLQHTRLDFSFPSEVFWGWVTFHRWCCIYDGFQAYVTKQQQEKRKQHRKSNIRLTCSLTVSEGLRVVSWALDSWGWLSFFSYSTTDPWTANKACPTSLVPVASHLTCFAAHIQCSHYNFCWSLRASSVYVFRRERFRIYHGKNIWREKY